MHIGGERPGAFVLEDFCLEGRLSGGTLSGGRCPGANVRLPCYRLCCVRFKSELSVCKEHKKANMDVGFEN